MSGIEDMVWNSVTPDGYDMTLCQIGCDHHIKWLLMQRTQIQVIFSCVLQSNVDDIPNYDGKCIT